MSEPRSFTFYPIGDVWYGTVVRGKAVMVPSPDGSSITMQMIAEPVVEHRGGLPGRFVRWWMARVWRPLQRKIRGGGE